MGSYKPTQLIDRLRSERLFTDEQLYWRRFQTSAIIQEPGHVSCVNFSPVSPHYLAASSSIKITLYDTGICEPRSTFSRFKQNVYGGSFRNDGSLLVTGGEEGKVKVFDVRNTGSRNALRTYKAHQRAVHSAMFRLGGQQLVSFGDDHAIRCWDLGDSAASLPVVAFTDVHTDHIRCGHVGHTSDHLIVSGSYDHSAKYWDCRTRKLIVSVDHGCPIEALLLFQNDSLLATAGGTVIRIWDLASGGRQLAQMSNHHKTVTCLAFASGGSRLLSGGIDRHVKIYDTTSYQVVHSMDFPGTILSIAVSPDDNVLAVGMADGNLLSIQRKQADRKMDTSREQKAQKATVSQSEIQSEGQLIKKQVSLTTKTEAVQLRHFDYLLKGFKHSKALDVLLSSSFLLNRRPELLVSALRELDRRRVLRRSLAGRDHRTLAPLLRFLSRHLALRDYSRTLMTTADSLVDIYGNEKALESSTVKLFAKLRDSVQRELAVQMQLCETVGAMDTLFRAVVQPMANYDSRSAPIFGQPIVQPIPLTEFDHS